jgi:hypothetical protein
MHDRASYPQIDRLARSRRTITISNIAGGDERRFYAVVEDGHLVSVSDAAIRHARRQGSMGYTCSDPDAATMIDRCVSDDDASEVQP